MATRCMTSSGSIGVGLDILDLDPAPGMQNCLDLTTASGMALFGLITSLALWQVGM